MKGVVFIVKDIALTTSDNPFNPITEFDLWFKFDELKGYHTCSYLDRVANTSSSLPDSFNEEEIERAMMEIVQLNLIGIVTNNKINYEIVSN